MELEKGSQLGPYEVVAPLGAGGMGEVYRAHDSRIGRDVAIKLLTVAMSRDEEWLRRFEQEARTAGSLNHPNLVTIFEFGSHEGVPYIVMELLEGRPLREILESGRISLRRAVDYGIQIANGLAAAHEKYVIHRDLKPDNIIVMNDGRVKILDFGLAKDVSVVDSGARDVTARHLTRPGMVVGTLGYMSPEQVSGQPVDHRTDLFSLGILLFEMLTGRPLFAGNTAGEAMAAVVRDDPPELMSIDPAIPIGLDHIVRRCLEKKAPQRFQSAGDLAFDLQEVIVGSDPRASFAGLAAAARRKRRPIAAIAAALLLLAAGLALGYLLTHRPELHPTYDRMTFRRGTIFAARFAPQGQLLYSATWDGDLVSIFSTARDAPESRPLAAPGTQLLAVSQSGEMAILTGASLTGHLQYRGTLARVGMGGAPREVLENVVEADWAPDGKDLAVVRFENGVERLEYPIGNVLHQSRGITHPRFSPQGDEIAFLDHPAWADDLGSVMVVDLKKKQKTTLSGGWEGVEGLAWSHDGKELYFSATTAGYNRSVFSVTRSGKRRLVLNSAGGLTLHDVGPDGRLLISSDTNHYHLNVLAPGETQQRDLTWLGGSMAVDLSRDGKTVLFGEVSEAVGANYATCVRGTDGGPVVRLTEGFPAAMSPDGKWVVSRLPLFGPSFTLSPTGPGTSRTIETPIQIFPGIGSWFADGHRLLLGGHAPGRSDRCYIYDVATGKLVRPVTPEGVDQHPAVSPDGMWIAADGIGQPVRLYPAGGGAPRDLGMPVGSYAVGWSDDGRFLYVGAAQRPPVTVSRIEIATGRAEVVQKIAPSDPAGVEAVSTLLMAADGKAMALSYRRTLSDLYVVTFK